MANRGTKIAGPLIWPRAADKQPAKPAEVRAALETASIHPAVIREWEHEAGRRFGIPSEEVLRGKDFRDIQRVRVRARILSGDRRRDRAAGINTKEKTYRPGVMRRLIAKIGEVIFIARAKRRAQRAARKAQRRAQ